MSERVERCKLCGGQTKIRTTAYTRYRDCLSCGETWAIESTKAPPHIMDAEELVLTGGRHDDQEEELIHELGG